MSDSKDTRTTLDDLLVSRFFWVPSFESYGSVAGLYDLGPLGSSLESNIINLWKRKFITGESMLEVRCSALTPLPVLQASGHTDKFNDYMLRDLVNSNFYRADKYISSWLEEKIPVTKDETKKSEMKADLDAVDGMSCEDMINVIEKYQIKSPDGNDMSKPYAFNLMFGTSIGPGEKSVQAFLRPETAQGIFVNFPRLYNFNRNVLPFAAAQVGVSYRNEISPRNGLVRCREFMMAEIEHFADPEELDNYPKFDLIADIKVKFFSEAHQLEKDEAKRVPIELTIREAYERKIIPHKTIGYYIGRVYEFLILIGIGPESLRFRQHRSNELAHYSRCCWDAEIYSKTSGWLECVGIADRQSFDLTRHAQFTARKGEKQNSAFVVTVQYPEPINRGRKFEISQVDRFLNSVFKKDSSKVVESLANLTMDQKKEIAAKRAEADKVWNGKIPDQKQMVKALAALSDEDKQKINAASFEIDGRKITYEMYKVIDEDDIVKSRSFIPCVIEPSMGVGRVMTQMLEQAFYIRSDGLRRVLKLSPSIAPYKVLLVPLSNKISKALISKVVYEVSKYGLSYEIDDTTATIGKRYARNDELGTPFGITIDFESEKNESVTLRERDSMNQVRGSIVDVVAAVNNMVAGTESWDDVYARIPHFSSTSDQ